MKYIFAAAALMGVLAQGAVVRREAPPSYGSTSAEDCPEPSDNSAPGTDSSPSSGSTTSPSGSGSGSSSSSGSGPAVDGCPSSLNYTVVSGDTLGSIAGSQHSGICNIATANNIQNINLIEIGQVLIIPTGCTNIDNTTCAGPAPVAASATCVAGLPNSYTVVSGDTTSKIAADFNITLDGLLAANPAITNPDAIQVGQVINIPVCPNSQCDIVGTYIVQSGDLYYDLATKYTTTVGQIKSLNPQVDPTKLAVGQTIILPQNCHNLTSATA